MDTFLATALPKLASRKFWVWIASAAADIALLLSGQIDGPKFLLAFAAASTVYSTAEAHVDGKAAAADTSPTAQA